VLHVTDTQSVTGGLVAHRGRLSGAVHPGQGAVAEIDGPRREATRRNHTATHLLHAALRSVLGDHVRQQGSFVAPDRLRFDFSHGAGLHEREWDDVTTLVNDDVLANAGVETVVVGRREAEAMGAIAFFGDRYGDRVRVVRAGEHSLEFCGGTHVHHLGDIGQIQVVSESSIGANTRRIEAVSGLGAVSRARSIESALESSAALLKTSPEDVPQSIERLLERQRDLEKTVGALRQKQLASLAGDLATSERDGTVVARVDGYAADQLRQLAQDVLRRGQSAVVIAGEASDGKVSVVAATDGHRDATELVRTVAAHVGGSGGGSSTLAMAGGKDVAGLDAALVAARAALT
jgi:alanyl-tRNA synthetase